MAKQRNYLLGSCATTRTALSIALGVPLGAACSLTLNLDQTHPCTDSSECEYTNGRGRCVEGFCQPPDGSDGTDSDTVEPTTGSTLPGDTGNSSTTDDPTATDTDTSTDLCEVNSDCNIDQRCSDAGACTNLLSPECDILQWPDDEDRDDVVFLGSIMPTRGLFTDLVQPLENAFQLAVEDFNNTTTLPGGRGVAWVGCDSTMGADAARTAAEHLRDAVGAPAVVGPIFSEGVREVVQEVAVDADMFIISPTATAPSLSNLEDNNLLWRVTPSDVFQGNGLVDRMVGDLNPPPARLLILNKDDAYGNELRDLIQTDLVNGLGIDFVHFFSYPGPETFESQEDLLASYGGILGQALTESGVTTPAAYMNPEDHYTHVLILGTSEAEVFIVSYLGIWAEDYSMSGVPLPLITISHGAVPNMPEIVANVGVTPGTEPLAMLRPLLQSAMRGVSPNIFDPDNFDAFNIRYRIRFSGQDALTSSSLGYDAAMAAMFAMVTVPGDDSVTGSLIAEGMASLNDPDGAAVSFGDPVAVFIQDARNALAAGNTVDLQGVSGALNWDASTGDLRADVLGWNLTGSADDPELNVNCIYALGAPPDEDGNWVSAMDLMPPCN